MNVFCEKEGFMFVFDVIVKEVWLFVFVCMDWLLWLWFYWLIVVGFGFFWIFDGFEV